MGAANPNPCWIFIENLHSLNTLWILSLSINYTSALNLSILLHKPAKVSNIVSSKYSCMCMCCRGVSLRFYPLASWWLKKNYSRRSSIRGNSGTESHHGLCGMHIYVQTNICTFGRLLNPVNYLYSIFCIQYFCSNVLNTGL